ncbi:MAG: M20/M25/M40 family metallo-hydrolase, partial [Candidatus Dormibacteraeota bacterium]|nr:M20/M25/M40 family metallo-hydrolase [Candidatus Dormibacteraeota bacterium]
MSLDQALALARQGRGQAEADLLDYLAIPSISALPEHAGDCRRAAGWIEGRLRAAGLETRLEQVHPEGKPVVVGEWRGRPGAPTLTIYGHYDVQPADPLEEWLTPPFEPTVQDGFVYARGADDNKGQHLAGVEAIACWVRAGGPPLNLRFLIEGEEEESGRSLPDLVRGDPESYATEHLLLADGAFTAPGRPNLLTGLRGLLYVEIEVTGPRVDLHSGLYGGVAPNPMNSLAHVLAGLKDREGRVLVPGFYDAVTPPAPEELAAWRSSPLDEAALLQAIGTAALAGEPGQGTLERLWARPTLDVHGIAGGFTGEGSKTVIPARAVAKVSMRLVPGQTPEGVLAALHACVPGLATPGTIARVTELNSASPVLIDVTHAGIGAASRAFEAAFGAAPLLQREGA